MLPSAASCAVISKDFALSSSCLFISSAFCLSFLSLNNVILKKTSIFETAEQKADTSITDIRYRETLIARDLHIGVKTSRFQSPFLLAHPRKIGLGDYAEKEQN